MLSALSLAQPQSRLLQYTAYLPGSKGCWRHKASIPADNNGISFIQAVALNNIGWLVKPPRPCVCSRSPFSYCSKILNRCSCIRKMSQHDEIEGCANEAEVIHFTTLSELQPTNPTQFMSSSKKLDCINEYLETHGYPLHVERQVQVQPSSSRCERLTLPKEWFVHLQRLYACILLDPESKPEPFDAISTCDLSIYDDTTVDAAIDQYPSSHLLCHATEGFYIPVDFDGAPIFDPDDNIPGGWIGSSFRLIDELLELSIPLDIGLTPLKGAVPRGGGYDLSAACIADLNSVDANHKGGFHKERMVWFALYECARLSIENDSALLLY